MLTAQVRDLAAQVAKHYPRRDDLRGAAEELRDMIIVMRKEIGIEMNGLRAEIGATHSRVDELFCGSRGGGARTDGVYPDR